MTFWSAKKARASAVRAAGAAVCPTGAGAPRAARPPAVARRRTTSAPRPAVCEAGGVGRGGAPGRSTATTAAVSPHAPSLARTTCRPSTMPKRRPPFRPAHRRGRAAVGRATSQAAVSPQGRAGGAGSVSSGRRRPADFRPCLCVGGNEGQAATAKGGCRAGGSRFGQKIGLGPRPSREAVRRAAASSGLTRASSREPCGTAKTTAR